MNTVRAHIGTCLVGVLCLAACSGGESLERTVAPSTSESTISLSTEFPTTSASPTSSYIPGGTISTTTTRSFGGAPTTTLAEPAGAFVNGRKEPVLGSKTGWHFYVLVGPQIFVVDLDTGAITETAVPPSPADGRVPEPFGQFYPVDNGLFFYADGLVVVDAMMKAPPKRIPDATFVDFRGTAPDRIWARTPTGYNEFGVDGSTTNTVAFPTLFDAGAIGRELVVPAAGRIFLVDMQSGASREWAVGELTNVGRGWIVWRECTEQLTCRSYAGTAANPKQRAIEPTSSKCGEWFEGYHDFCDGSFSANGRFYLAYDDTSPTTTFMQPTVFDLEFGGKTQPLWPTTRRSINLGDFDGLMFSPDGQWLFGMETSGRIAAVHFESGKLLEFDVVKPRERAFGAFAIG